jgi:Aminotransferase class-V
LGIPDVGRGLTASTLLRPSVEIGLRHLEDISIDIIHERVRSLTDLLLSGLQALRHRNGASLVHIYGPTINEGRGGTITMNFFDPDGHLVHPKEIEREAAQARISIRSGCHCNPGAGETALHITEDQMAELFRANEPTRIERFLHAADAMREGAIRASLGMVSNVADVTAFLHFAERFQDCPVAILVAKGKPASCNRRWVPVVVRTVSSSSRRPCRKSLLPSCQHAWYDSATTTGTGSRATNWGLIVAESIGPFTVCLPSR